MIHAILDGALDNVEFHVDPVFNLALPAYVPNVPAEVLEPRNAWSDRAAYDGQAQKLAEMFAKNFEKFGKFVSPEVIAAGPRVVAA